VRTLQGLVLVLAVAGGTSRAPAQGAAPGAPAQITLRAQAVVQGPDVRLTDLVEERLPAAWAQLAIAPAPPAGQSMEISQARVRRTLALGAVASPPAVRGAASCRVRNDAALADDGALTGSLHELLDALPLPAGALGQRFQVTSMPSLVAVAGKLCARLQGDAPLVGPGSVRVEFLRGGAMLVAAHVGVVRELRAVVCTAARSLPAGTALSPSDVVLDTLWIDRPALWEQALRPPHAPGITTAHAVAAGEVLQSGSLRRTPLVVRGAPLEWVVWRGALLVVVHATARESGALGDWVWVESPFNRKLARVQVTGPGRVGDPLPAACELARAHSGPNPAAGTSDAAPGELP
jgi:flagella basal body P-ring formation protein FlgA